MKLRVMVTGAGSGVAQGIVKSLNISGIDLEIIAADIDAYNPLFHRCKEIVILPKLENEVGPENFIDIVKKNRINVIMTGSVFELSFLAQYKNEIEKETGALVVVCPASTIDIGLDKWATSEFLRQNDLPYPKSFLPSSLDQALDFAARIGYPLILKPRRGRGSRGLHLVRSPEELKEVFSPSSEPLLQKMIAKPSEALDCEYSCSIVKTKSGIIGPFTARRTLRGGHSWVIEVKQVPELHPLLLAIGQKLPFFGSLNIQLMQGQDGPVPFEFNPRFSGTTAIRAHFGFNEPEMIIRSYCLGEDVKSPQIRDGLAFRYFEEVYVEGLEFSGPDNVVKGAINQWL